MTDWETLSKQFKALGVNFGKDKPPSAKRVQKYPIESVVEGEFWESIYGQVFYHKELYPYDHQHGAMSLWPNHPITRLCEWAQAKSLSNADLYNFIFLDTETSGLAGGTGTYAFEVGVGRFTAEGFKLAQFFMRHPGEEPALLTGLMAFIDGMQAVVTYNGKAFDIPLLNTRFTLMGITSPFYEIDHFDLLPLARRLWRTRLESRTLSNVENHILGVTRGEEEVPGYLIPELYFEYLKSQDARPLAGVFYHNAIDILSLAGLFSHMAILLHEPDSETIQHSEDVVALARHFEASGDSTQAEWLYKKALQGSLPSDVHWDAVFRLSFILKRKGSWDSAIRLWEEAAQANQWYAYEEIAKYYEHHAKDLLTAQAWVLRAQNALQANHVPTFEYQRWWLDFEHRVDRINRKLARAQDPG